VDEILAGGVANAGQVIRQGDFVLRPSNPYSETIHAFLTALRSKGFTGASLPVEVQSDGCERLIFIEEDVPVPPFPAWAQTNDALESIAKLMLSFHKASARVEISADTWSDEMADPDRGPIICHNDVCLENVVFQDGKAIGLLDFDFAAPGRPIYDLAAFVRMCVPVDDDVSAERTGWSSADRPARVRLVADTYGLNEAGSQELLMHLDRSINEGGTFVKHRVEAGDPNFIRMLEDMGGMERYERRRRWWEVNRHRFVAALAYASR
jgi:hypothetical protein